MNENQEVVLNHLKENVMKDSGILTKIQFSEDHFGAEYPEDVEKAFRSLTEKEDYEILKAFAEWGLSNC